jgi:hypothetical protein
VTTYPFKVADYPAAYVDLIYFDAGGGHRTSAKALMSAAEQQHRGWQINLINLRELLEPADVIRRVTGVRVEDFYNSQLKSGLTIGTAPLLRMVQMLIRQLEPAMIGLLARHWQRSHPDLVVSMIPNFNHAILAGIRHVRRISGSNANRSTWFAGLLLRPGRQSRWDMHEIASFAPQA